MARATAAALRRAIPDPATTGTANVPDVEWCQPLRAERVMAWPGLPGFVRSSSSTGLRYTHDALPGWEYRRREIVREMILDFDALAERGGLMTAPHRAGR